MKIPLEIELDDKFVEFYRSELPPECALNRYLSFLCEALLQSLYDSEQKGGPVTRPDAMPPCGCESTNSTGE